MRRGERRSISSPTHRGSFILRVSGEVEIKMPDGRVYRGQLRRPQIPRLYQGSLPECPPLLFPVKMDVGVHSANVAYPSRTRRISSSTSACFGTCGQSAITTITPFGRTPTRMCVL